MTLFAALEQSAARFPERGAVYKGSAQLLSYGELHAAALRLAGGLLASGAVGDRIAIASKNCPEMILLMYGAWAAGMIVAPVNAKLHPREMAQIVEDAAPRWIFASDDLASPLRELVADPPSVIAIGSAAFGALTGGMQAEPQRVAAEAPAWLFYTSGTTGRSKGAVLSHRNLSAMTVSHLADFEDLSEVDSLIHAAPMSHGSGLYILPYVARGARNVIPESGAFDADEFLYLTDRHPGAGAFLAPTMVQRLRAAFERSGRSFHAIRSIIYGGGPMYLDEIKRSLACFGPIFRQLYGQGESPMTITGLRQRDFSDAPDDVLRSVGWPRAGLEVAIFDDQDRPLPLGTPGEIVCRGDVVMHGYWRNAEASAATLRSGWLHTGDIGIIDVSGRLTLLDRSKDVIISGGTNIYPREVEDALLSHTDVCEVAVIGREDHEWGEIVIAFVVVEPGRTVSETELDSHCLATIARFKRPKHYVFVEALPKSSYGKILKRELAGLAPDSGILPE
ncbi:AMP-binding protein [Sphingomonas sp. MG17]|uniref:3-methylmercaptopropionyl-CoA ligase n=1 Tax=Sphingomonas tagetis TaxID=2949092 RepID=A0A9X2HI38_9SPHN|nr:AMP-binding protein [Sphingomonas tagetis]MCP3730337.1 AMP-binding protein [Sphingomonas tagetis]